MRRAVLLCLPILLLTACGGGDPQPSAEACQSAEPDSDLGQQCLEIARQVASEALASETPTGGEATELDPSECQDPAYAEVNAEFCYGGGYADAAPVESPVSEPYTWPEGITARVVSVATTPEADYDDPAADTRVVVTVEFTNDGTAAFVWSGNPNIVDGGPYTRLFYGENRYEANAYFADNNLPQQLQPGTSATWSSLAYMPSAELGALSYTVAPTRDHLPWTFTEVETLLP